MQQKLNGTHVVFGRREACLVICMAYLVGLTRFSFLFFAYSALLAWTLYWPTVLKFLGGLMEGSSFGLSRSTVCAISVACQIVALMLFIAAARSPTPWITGSAIMCASAATGWDWCRRRGDASSVISASISGQGVTSGSSAAFAARIAAILTTAVVSTGLFGLPMRWAAPGYCYIAGAILLYLWPVGEFLGTMGSDLLRFAGHNGRSAASGQAPRRWGAATAKVVAILLVLLSVPITGTLFCFEMDLYTLALFQYFALGWIYIGVVLTYYVFAKLRLDRPVSDALQGSTCPATAMLDSRPDRPVLKGDFLSVITLLVVVSLPFVAAGELWLVLVLFHERGLWN